MPDDYEDLILTTAKWLTKPNWVKEPQRSIGLDSEETDANGANLKLYAPVEYNAIQITYGYSSLTKADEYAMLAFFAATLGRCNRFWLPVWKNSFILNQPIAQYDYTATINSIGFSNAFRGFERVFFELSDGSMLSRMVTSSVDNGDGTETLHFLTRLDRAIAIADVSFFGRFILARLESDLLEVAHATNALSETEMKFMELVGEYEGESGYP